MSFRTMSLLGLLSAGVMMICSVAFAQGPGQGGGPGGDRYEGTVSNLTSTGFTLTTRFGDQSVAVTTTSDTKYGLTTNVGIAALHTGDNVRVAGMVNDTALTVTARMIQIAPHAIKGNPNAPTPPAGQMRHGIMGTVTTTTPALTVTALDGKVYTVTTTDRTMVRQSQPTMSTSVTNGADVAVTGTESGDPSSSNLAIAANHVEVMPAPLNGGGGGQHRNQNPQNNAIT